MRSLFIPPEKSKIAAPKGAAIAKIQIQNPYNCASAMHKKEVRALCPFA
jgi:hypothetical protein